MGFFDIFRKKKTMTLEEVVKEMKKEGYSDKEIKERLTKQTVGQVFEGLGYSEERIEELKQGVTNDKVTSDTIDEYQWVAEKCDVDDEMKEYILTENGKDFINDDGICKDCLDRDGEKGTDEYFETIGKPGSGFSMCGSGCACKIFLIEDDN
jgi:hypothetical protein